ncbi:MAG: hypothetical protein JXA83_06010 [Acidimicrobiales bacterium]|nr:hypothetical protein [Acidimicrobiales bacterium]
MATNVTVSLGEDTVAQIRQAAADAGLSLSAWLGRAAQKQLLRDSMDAHDRWRRENPLDAARADAEAQLDELDREAARIVEDLGQMGQAA